MKQSILIAALLIILIAVAIVIYLRPAPAAQFDSLPIADQIEWAIVHGDVK